MTLTRRFVLTCGVALLLPATVIGQPSRPGYTPPTDGRLLIEGLFSRHRVPGDAYRTPAALDGYGGRMLWALAPTDEAPRSWSDRLFLGAFVVGAADPAKSATTLHSGIQADLRLRRERVTRVEPLLSLGAGAFWSKARESRHMSAPRIIRFDGQYLSGAPALTPVVRDVPVERSWTSLAVTPGVGVRLLVSPDFAVRFDARQVMGFRKPLRHTPELMGGLSLRL